jgi:multidrug efflux pump subunit AcrB
MLPFDNKSELQLVIDMPEGTTLEETARVTKALTQYVRTIPETRDYQAYVGTASPFNFNGLVRHYYLRDQPYEADIQINLVAKEQRKTQSHDIAQRIRSTVQDIGRPFGANVKVLEVPPGPPVQSVLVAEIYGPDYERQRAIAREVRGLFETTAGVVDVDDYLEADQGEVCVQRGSREGGAGRDSVGGNRADVTTGIGRRRCGAGAHSQRESAGAGATAPAGHRTDRFGASRGDFVANHCRPHGAVV